MRAFAVALTVLFGACGAPATALPSSTPVPTREPGNVEVSVLLDLSGARSAIGNAQRNAIQLWLDQNPSRRIRVKFIDLGSSDPRLLLELRRAAIEDRADAVVIGAPVEYGETFARAVVAAALPIILTLPSPDPAQSRWAFGLGPTYADLARLELDDVVARGLAAPALLVSDDTPVSIAERIAIGREFDRRGLVRPTVVSVTPQDAAQRIRPGASVARSVLLTGAVSSYLDAARSLASTGITPRTYVSYVSESGELSGLREAQSMVTWPGSRNVVTSNVPPPALPFLQQYIARYGAPSTVAASAYDAFEIIDAAGASGSEPAGLRDRIERGSFAGVASTYTFSPARHAGFRTSDLAYLRWTTAGRPAIALAPEPSN